jgi:hypothetical protein
MALDVGFLLATLRLLGRLTTCDFAL